MSEIEEPDVVPAPSQDFALNPVLTLTTSNLGGRVDRTTSRKSCRNIQAGIEEDIIPAVQSGKGPKSAVEDDTIYNRFSPRKKRNIIFIVAFAGFQSPLAGTVLLPAIPQVASDLHSTVNVINITVAVYVLMMGIAPLFWSPFASFYGRRFVYLASMPIGMVASIGVGFSKNVPELVVTRILQAIGTSSVVSVGAGTVGDIYRPTERATAMAMYYSGTLLGPSISPVLGGVFAQYISHGWRACQYCLGGAQLIAVLLIFFLLPETAHPPLPHDLLRKAKGKPFVFHRINPLRILKLLRWPNIVCMTFVSGITLMCIYLFIIPLGSISQTEYHITNVAVVGCLYLVGGAGNIVGSRVAGPWADAIVRRRIVKRGYRRPEDRLLPVFSGIGVVVPLSCIGFGWVVQYRAGGIGPMLVFNFFAGMSTQLVSTPLNTYLIDCMPRRSAEVMAVSNLSRFCLSAAASAFVTPMSDAIGWGLNLTIWAIVCWIATFLLYLTYRYGEKWREREMRIQNVTAEGERIRPAPA